MRTLQIIAADALLGKMTGRWVLTGTIAKQQTTHDVDVDWILNRENDTRRGRLPEASCRKFLRSPR